jgi:hypothetical protein
MKAHKPEFVAAKSRFLRRKRILKAVRDVERGHKDTERRGIPSDVPGDVGSEASRRKV